MRNCDFVMQHNFVNIQVQPKSNLCDTIWPSSTPFRTIALGFVLNMSIRPIYIIQYSVPIIELFMQSKKVLNFFWHILITNQFIL